MKLLFRGVFGLALAMSLAIGPKASAVDGFWVMGSDVPLSGQTNWNAYQGGDAPEGAYMGWLYAGTTSLQGSINLGRTLAAGKYYVMPKVIDYMGGGRVQIAAGNGGATISFNNDDWNKYWTGPVGITTSQAFTQLNLTFIKTVAPTAVQKYLLRGLYITTNANENVPLYGFDRIVNYRYPTGTNTIGTAKGNLIQNSSFELGMGHGWGFLAEGYEREFAISELWNTNSSYHGLASVRFPVKGNLISRTHKVRPNRIHTVSLWARSSSAAGVGLGIYNVATAPPGFPPVLDIYQTFTTGPLWKRVSIRAFLPAYPHSDYQLKIYGTPDVFVDAVQLEEGELSDFNTRAAPEVGFVNGKPGRILFEDESPALDLVAYNNSTQAFSGTMVFEMFDIFNRKISSGERPLSVSPFSRSIQAFPVPNRRGISRVVAWVKDTKGTLEESVYAVVPRPRVNGIDESSIIGVHPNLNSFQLAMHQRLGIKWARAMSPAPIFRWADVEPVEGQITWYDEKVDRAAPYGMSILGTIGSNDGWPAWANDNGMPNLAKWESFVERLVTHYRGRVRYWEIWNEPIYTFTPQFYSELLKRAAVAIRRADPNARIVGMGGVYSKDWILQVMGYLGADWNQYLDHISTHLYPESTDPSGGETEARAVSFKREVIDRYGIEVWNTETGVWDEGFYKTANSNFGPMGDAMWPYLDSERYFRGCYHEPERLVANFVHCVGNGLTKYFYYDSRIFADPSYQRTHPTMLEYDDSFRSKGIAYAIAGYFVDGARGLGSVSPATNMYAYLFDRGGAPTVALWSKDKLNHSVSLGGSGWQAFDMMGNAMPVTNATVLFGRAPAYVRSAGLSVDAMRLAFQSASVANVADTQPPNLSVDEFPTGPTAQGTVSLRWLGVDDTSISSATEPNAVTYSYFLQGRDADWSAWTPATHVTYTSLSSTNYIFRVKARDAAGNISSVESRPITTVAPPRAPTGLRFTPGPSG